jgi:hypothetical protein
MLTDKQLKKIEQNAFLKGDVMLNDVDFELLREKLDIVLGESKSKPVSNTNLLDGIKYVK